MSRPLRPVVNTVGDNPIAQVKCEPERDEINIEELLNEILVRFEFGLGTSFDLQLLTMDGTEMLAFRRYIVTKAVEELVVSNMNFANTMSRTVNRRSCQPISDWFVFNEVAEILRGSNGVAHQEDAEDFDIENASPAVLQAFVKEKRGKGFRPGTSRDDMVVEAKKYL